MTGQKYFRLLMPDGLLSQDTFVVAAEQPSLMRADCLLVVHQGSGMMLTVNSARLFPAEAAGSPPFSQRVEACLRCGRVKGVAEDQVACPYHGQQPCELLQPAPQTPANAGGL
jgi:hypothetical protein